MKAYHLLGLLAVLVSTEGQAAFGAEPDKPEGVALAIVFDTSGSMKDPVRDSNGGTAPKYTIANRALHSVIRQVEAFQVVSKDGPKREVEATLITFNGDDVRTQIPFGALNPVLFHNFANNFSRPNGNTPLGKSLQAAYAALSSSKLSRKHVLVITDGINTAGPGPAEVYRNLSQKAARTGSSFGVHFVAFDIDAKVFEPLKKQGVTVVAAADERQLNDQLQFILAKKILLEDEEPAKPNK